MAPIMGFKYVSYKSLMNSKGNNTHEFYFKSLEVGQINMPENSGVPRYHYFFCFEMILELHFDNDLFKDKIL